MIMRTISAKQWEILCTGAVVVDQRGNVWSVRVDGGLLREEVMGDFL